jgi:CheY-like chemotaxis protein
MRELSAPAGHCRHLHLPRDSLKAMTLDSTLANSAAPRALRVLIVEDETLISLSLQGVLRELGHSVSGIAPSLRTALAVAAGTPYDIGVDTAAALLERYGIPSLLMTGASFAEIGDRIESARPLALLTKPYTEEDVAQALHGALQKLAR